MTLKITDKCLKTKHNIDAYVYNIICFHYVFFYCKASILKPGEFALSNCDMKGKHDRQLILI